jgi:hypothetical protein
MSVGGTAIPRAITLAAFAAALGACHELARDQRSITSPNAADTKGGAHVRPALAASGCAVVVDRGTGEVATIALTRRQLPFAIPSLDSAVVSGGLPHAFQIAHYRIATSGAQALDLSCIAPFDEAYEHQLSTAMRTKAARADWTEVLALLNKQPTQADSQPRAAIGGQTLRLALYPGAKLTERHVIGKVVGAGTSSARLLPSSPPNNTITNLADWKLAATDTFHVPALQPVIITASATDWVIDNSNMYRSTYLAFKLDYRVLQFDYYFYNGDYCADANAFYWAQQFESDKQTTYGTIMQQLSDALGADGPATASNGGQAVCVPNSEKPVCIDFFIMADRAAVFLGDDRNFDPDAGFRASRVQLYLNPNTLAWEVKYNESTLVAFGIPVLSKTDSGPGRMFDPNQDVQVSRNPDDGFITITMAFRNNFCISRTTFCPVIDAKVGLEPSSNSPGGFEVFFRRDGFPSMGVYRRKADNSGWDTMAQDTEMMTGAYTNWLALVGTWNQHIQMPNGCHLF